MGIFTSVVTCTVTGLFTLEQPNLMTSTVSNEYLKWLVGKKTGAPIPNSLRVQIKSLFLPTATEAAAMGIRYTMCMT
ncbi:hypothetical protein ES703_112354 [subsurface metagenome]